MQDARDIATADLIAMVRDLARGFDAVRLELRELRTLIESKRPVVEVAEADRRALAALLPVIGTTSGAWWSIAALHRLAKDSPALARALRVHPDRRALGRLLSRAEGATVGDWLIERSARDGREGALRRVTFCLR